ncbi:NAD(P)-dependent alcohol dehydrogenase [Burkholderia sp. Bp9143]|uniref:NAD(P)-dependent alcohol dehydrogenase n=1 Tax=Burkholderia sp. Bp9143 TaxID=2184574 RepID=UPI000F59D848|nr:NAD(P)-dependent alcohol dehydrogenase [Burkholderia sp. Bp9143]RQR21828.1 NAD(P)-dependent alcohol dehydrogenase [Burkholderia sp. Bp9143]
MNTLGYAADGAGAPLKPYAFQRRSLRSNDIAIDILYCGVCHTDLHKVRNDWKNSVYPLVPGHEIVGRVSEIGSDVTRFKVGDAVAVGCIVDSCMHCDQCRLGEEQFCREGMTPTYGGRDRLTQAVTLGGYSNRIVVRDEFVLTVPAGLDLSRVAPLLCAGITTYSPLRKWGVERGSRVGVIGLGGLGHMAVKLAVGLGAHVTVIGRTASKEADAMALGADAFLVSSDEEAMTNAKSSFDVVIDTVPVRHDVSPYMVLLDIGGALVIVGQIGPIDEQLTMPFVFGRRSLAGSLIGGIAETQAMLEFCAEKNILPDCEIIQMDQINEAFERLDRSDVRYRFVIDMASLRMSSASTA